MKKQYEYFWYRNCSSTATVATHRRYLQVPSPVPSAGFHSHGASPGRARPWNTFVRTAESPLADRRNHTRMGSSVSMEAVPFCGTEEENPCCAPDEKVFATPARLRGDHDADGAFGMKAGNLFTDQVEKPVVFMREPKGTGIFAILCTLIRQALWMMHCLSHSFAKTNQGSGLRMNDMGSMEALVTKNQHIALETDSDGNSALHYSVLRSKLQAAEILMRLGADSEATNASGSRLSIPHLYSSRICLISKFAYTHPLLLLSRILCRHSLY